MDLPIDYERLTEVGSIMGSGGLIVMDEQTCMVDVARYFLDFLRGESCGKCTSCREGIAAMHDIVADICDGKGEPGQIELLQDLAEAVTDASLCALGGTAPNPVLSTLRYFQDEYGAHINDKKCPAGVCRALIRYRIDPEKCKGCMLCSKQCPAGAISGEQKKTQNINEEKCIKCGVCTESCKFEAVLVE
jgi:NAD-dependent dihydropyrimidine dehydrogenase PreA subunit